LKQTKPPEARGFRDLVIIMLASNREKQSHGDELVFESVGYRDSRLVFRQVATNFDVLYCRFVRARFGKANKPKQSQDS